MESPDVMKRYSAIVSALLVLGVCLFGAYKIHENMTKQIVALNAQKAKEIEKNTLLDQIKMQERRIKSYKKFLNAKDPATLLSVISRIAKESGVKVIAMKPLEESSLAYYTRYPFELTLEASSYHYFGSFLSKIESDQDVFIVERAQIVFEPPRNDAARERVVLNLTISSIMAKE